MNQTNDNDKGAIATRGHLITAGGCCRMGKMECDESRQKGLGKRVKEREVVWWVVWWVVTVC